MHKKVQLKFLSRHLLHNLSRQSKTEFIFCGQTSLSFCFQYMSFRVKSRRLSIDNTIQEPLIFCTFINEQRLLLLFKSSQFMIADPSINPAKRITYQDALQTKQAIVECKRIKTNICALLSKDIEVVTFIRYVSDQQTIVGRIQVHEMELLRHLQVKNQLIVFNKNQFLIHSQSFQYKGSYFTIFTQAKHQFNYDINSKSYLYPHNFQTLIVKALPATSQMACFKQKDLQGQRKIALIRLSQQFQNEQLDISQLIAGQDQISDIIAKSEHQYGLFIVRQQLSGEFRISIYNCEVKNIYGKYSTTFHLSHNFNTCEPPFMNIIDVSPLNNYYLVKKYAHITQNGQIYDNFLQLHNLQTYQVLEKVACNLKMLDFSPSKLCLIDYSQQIESPCQIVLHIRKIFTKKYLYAFLLGSTKFTQILPVKKIHQDIIQLL